jgi:uroporphyrin-III C-methyltransferase
MMHAKQGTVYLVGAGPGDPELLTLKAAALLKTADIVLHDDLVPQAVLDCAGPQARIVSVGKRCRARRITQAEINDLMIAEAKAGNSVVRLKSGDPMVFGRAGEEMDALRAAGVPYAVVPGVTAMFAAAAAMGKSLTDRRSASKIILTTAHHATHNNTSRLPLWPGPLPQDATLGIYMPGRDLRRIAWELMAAGMPEDLPCIVLRSISLPEQQTAVLTLGTLTEFDPGTAPLMVLAGWPLRDQQEEILLALVQTGVSEGITVDNSGASQQV